MSGGRIAVLICAILLLLPAGCFLFTGLIVVNDHRYNDLSLVALPMAAITLGLAGFLFWIALRKRPRSPANTGPSA